jgi:hypothetical protein
MSISINQAADVHWMDQSAVQSNKMIEGGHIRTFEDLVGACRFAIEKAAEGKLLVRVFPENDPSLNLAQAHIALADKGAIVGNVVVIE